jgi:SAM-dependent methyltransferase
VIEGFTAYAPELAREAPGFDPKHYRVLAALEAENFWFRARNALILWAFGKFFPCEGRYLEIGCGTGYVISAVAREFPGLSVSGSEIFVEGLPIAAGRTPSGTFFQMDARSIPYEDEFDVVGAFDVVEHIEDDKSVLEEIHRALKPGGGVILTVPQHQWLWSRQDEIAHHVRRYSRGELARKLEASGFEVRFSTSFVTFLLPALIASRRLGSSSKSDEGAIGEFRLPRALNILFLVVMALERGLIKAGLRLPLGGSRLIVATKARA